MSAFETARRFVASSMELNGEHIAALQAHVTLSDGSQQVYALPVTGKVWTFLEMRMPCHLSVFRNDWGCMGFHC